jgi:hypothetical protein
LIASRIAGARLVLVKGGSHAFAMERAWRSNREVLRFLRDGLGREDAAAFVVGQVPGPGGPVRCLAPGDPRV